ncbi:MAG: hypothetical protein IRY94_16210 [Rhodospirillaceae bacterium]|nr:hypothetical protein [Rhodospirillaceae bacterium]
MSHVTLERLMAYADGELDEEESRIVERCVAADPGLAEQLAALRQQDSLLRSALKAFERTPVPPAARDAVLASAVPPWSWRRWLIPAFGMAAAVVVAAIAAGWTTANRIEHRLAALEATRAEDQRYIDQVVSQALESTVSGQAVKWQEPQRGLQGTVTPIRTYRAVNGQWCREYENIVMAGGTARHHHAVACREGENAWRDRALLPTDS